MRNLFLLTFFVFTLNSLFCQEEYVNDENLIRNYDHVYIDDIKTVQFHLVNIPFSNPIINLTNGSALVLTFDDLNDQAYDYTYEIIHCNSDWTQSELTELDYLNGFNNEVITNYEFSSNTLTNYINYRLVIPNQNTRLTKSGNYLLHIYEDGDKELPVLTRRFMVVENKMQIIPKLARTGSVSKSRTHQEIDFSVNHKGITINNPYTEVKVAVLQNGRWDNAITGVKPLFIREEQLVYDYQGKIIFPAGKEFRNFNIQSLRFKTERVARIVEDKVDKYHIQLFSDKDRSSDSYMFFNDLNGKFLIENDDRAVNGRIGADYAWVHLSLVADQEYEDANVYLFGGLTDWQIHDDFKLEYNAEQRIYTTKVFLKQGYYDYTYAYVRGAGSQPDLSELEGNWYETENEYQILVYYRPIGSRYDRLMAVSTVSSTR